MDPDVKNAKAFLTGIHHIATTLGKKDLATRARTLLGEAKGTVPADFLDKVHTFSARIYESVGS
jgi:hypothetical protein